MKKHTPTRCLLILILASLVLSASAVPMVQADGEFLEGDCEFAFFRCASDAMFIPGQYDLLTNCLIGYAFCKKYVEGA